MCDSLSLVQFEHQLSKSEQPPGGGIFLNESTLLNKTKQLLQEDQAWADSNG